MGIQLPLIKPLMKALDHFMDLYELQRLRPKLPDFNLVTVIDKISTVLQPMRAYLMPPRHVTFLIPGFPVTSHHGHPLRFVKDDSQITWHPVTIVTNLTLITAGL
jgi:hypothetical protein